MKSYCKLILLVILSLFTGCEKDSEDNIPKHPLIEVLDEKSDPLTQNPLEWTNEQLRFVDTFRAARIIGLGEATHGTKEFFDAKHRIFRYLVENHDYKVFAFEADFGESIFLNEAIQESRTADIKDLMLSKMHFWTWKTTEVQLLLEWMSDYNRGKNDADKIQYMGIDCQFNTYHPKQVKDYLEQTNNTLYEFSKDILLEVEVIDWSNYDSFDQVKYEELVEKVENIIDTVASCKEQLISTSNLKDFQLHQQILKVIKQVLIVKYYSINNDYTRNYRDEYMADNVEWLFEYFDNSKIAVWAHNYHVANMPDDIGGTMGFHLKSSFDVDYKVVGFSFSKGSFIAVGMEGEEYTGLETHTISQEPQIGSLNEIFSRSATEIFEVLIDDLVLDAYWDDLFESDLKIFWLGAAYNGNPEIYYFPIKKGYYNALIYFDTTQASHLLK